MYLICVLNVLADTPYRELISIQEKPRDLRLEISFMFKKNAGLPAAPVEILAVLTVSPYGKWFSFRGQLVLEVYFEVRSSVAAL